MIHLLRQVQANQASRRSHEDGRGNDADDGLGGEAVGRPSLRLSLEEV